MTRTDRLTAILDLLAETGQVEVDEIVTRLGVSPATARRDLDSLAERRLLSRTRGGATTGALAYDLPGRYNRDDHAAAKQQIALAASALIAPGMVIGLCGVPPAPRWPRSWQPGRTSTRRPTSRR